MRIITSIIILLCLSQSSFANSEGKPFKIWNDRVIYIDTRMPMYDYAFQSNSKKLKTYYKRLAKSLAKRNPIADANYAMKQGDYFLIYHYTNPQRKRILSQLHFRKLPPLPKNQSKLLRLRARKYFQGEESINTFSPAYSTDQEKKRIYTQYITTLERYRYYWNRTITYNLIQKERTWKYHIKRALSTELNPARRGKTWRIKKNHIVIVPSLPPHAGYGGIRTSRRIKRSFKTITNKRLIQSYFRTIYNVLRTRNPITDARLAIKRGEFYFISPHRDPDSSRIYKQTGAKPYYSHHYFKDIPNYGIQGSYINGFYYVRGNFNTAGDYNLDNYSAMSYFYTYHWNRTMERAVLNRKRIPVNSKM